jgi:F-type H+-transporting ATPase subunit epsilon
MVADNPIALEIVTPERRVVAETVSEAVLPGTEGYFGVLPGHAPFLTRLDTGEIRFRVGSQWVHLAVTEGFCEVLADRVTVLAQACERADEIDVDRAEAARRRAEEMLRKDFASEDEFRDAQAKFRRALVRLAVAKGQS